jgi:hypothetical protein
MKKIVAMLISSLFVGSMAMAADAEKSDSTTVDTSKNPITGTKKTVKKTKKSTKADGGPAADVTVKETTKEMKDGTVEKSTKAEADTTTKH